MKSIGRIAKDVACSRESAVLSALGIDYISSYGLDLLYASVILHYASLDKDFDLEIFKQHSNLCNIIPAGPRL